MRFCVFLLFSVCVVCFCVFSIVCVYCACVFAVFFLLLFYTDRSVV